MTAIADRLNLEFALIHKERKKANISFGKKTCSVLLEKKLSFVFRSAEKVENHLGPFGE